MRIPLLFAVALSTGVLAASEHPNIILILTDDQGYADLSCHGNPILKTPNIDRLCAEGVRFEDFRVSPTCSPTRSALLTGRHEFKNGVTHTIHERERLALQATTIAQVLKTAGYTTGIFGKWHLGDEDAYQPGMRGFDETFIHGAGGIGQSYPGTCGDAPGNTYFDPVIRHNGRFEKTKGYCTDVFFAQALKWLSAVKDTRPFFLYLATNAPHAPHQVRPEDAARYAGRVEPEVAKFYGMIANIDDNVGRLLKHLQDLELDRDTLVIFMNDNGGTAGCKLFNAGMRGSKATAFSGGTRASSFWRWPGTLKPGRVDRLTAHVDVFPTLAELAGAKLPDDPSRDGRSLVPLLRDPQHAWPDRYLVTHVGRWERGAAPVKFGACSVRWNEWNLVRTRDRWSLYNLKDDPGEQRDRAADHADIVENMALHYDAWWTDIQADLVNERAFETAPAANPFAEAYRKQHGVDRATPRVGREANS
jgi:arylsulfatase A-like enzyme